jgi:hypothetical protein
MKTRIFITAAIIFFSTTLAISAPKERTITFRDALGRTLCLPVISEEESAEATPFDTMAEFSRIRSNDINRVFDISQMSKPEKEEELPFDLETVFNSVK